MTVKLLLIAATLFIVHIYDTQICSAHKCLTLLAASCFRRDDDSSDERVSVTRFAEISPLWQQKLKSLGNFWIANSYATGQIIVVVNGQRLNSIIAIWSHRRRPPRFRRRFALARIGSIMHSILCHKKIKSIICASSSL